MARVPLIDPSELASRDLSNEEAAGKPLTRTLALGARPGLAAGLRAFGEAVETDSTLEPIVRETAIMAVVRRSPYQSRLSLPRAMVAGITDDMLEAIQDEDWTEPTFSPAQKAAFRFAMTFDAGHGINDASFDEIRAEFSREQIVELVALCSYYGALARMAIALAFEFEE